MIKKLTNKLFKPSSVLPLVFTRIFFGIFGVIHSMKFLMDPEWLILNFQTYKIQPSYSLFQFIQPISLSNIHSLILLMFILSLFISFGFLYRASIISYTIIFSYLFLINRQFYLNHYYFIILISFLMSFAPANCLHSVDAKLFPRIKTNTVPFFYQFLILFQMSIAYIFGGIAKLNPDWLHGYPLRVWIESLPNFSILNNFKNPEVLAYALSYSGLFFDLFIVLFLIFKKTRKIGLIMVAEFHILNAFLFNIGVFPYFSLVLTLLFLDDSFFIKLFNMLKFNQVKINKIFFKPNKNIIAVITIWMAIQVLVPLRSYIFNFNPKWSGVGDNFSWRMRLHDYKGDLKYKISDPVNKRLIIFDVEANSYQLFQEHQLGFVIRDPESIVLGAKHLAKMYLEGSGVIPEVYAISNLEVDGRAPQSYIDPTKDLTRVELRTFEELDILMPFDAKR